MSMNELSQAVEKIARCDTADFCGARPEALVLSAEQVLGLKFPPTYRLFLKQFGCGSVAGFEVYGIVNDEFEQSSIPNGIWLTLRLRRLAQAPPSLVFVSDTGDGGYYAIDVSRTSPDGESPVIIWWPGTNRPLEECDVVANDFGQFLHDEVTRAIQDWDEGFD